FGVAVRDDHVRADHRVRFFELRRRPEILAIDRERGHQIARREVRRERVRQPERGEELSAEQARAQNPERYLEAGPGNGLHDLARLEVAEVGLQLEHVLWERLR